MPKNNIRFSQVGYLTGMKRPTINARAKNLYQSNELVRSGANQILLNPLQVRKLIDDKVLCKGKIIYIGNLKGGVGKTTLSYLLTNAASLLGLKTCAIDLDVQANLTQQYMDIDVNQPVFHDIIDSKLNVKDVLVKINPTLDLIPSSLKNSLIPKALAVQTPKHHLSWLNGLCLSYLRSNYELIVVDTSPSLSTLNSVFTLCLDSNDNIVIPANADNFSVMGIQLLLDDVFSIRESYKSSSHPKISIIMNCFFQNQKNNLEMLMKMGKEHGERLSQIIIRDSAKIREIVSHKIPLSEVKQGREIYETIADLLQEFDIIKKDS